MRIEHFNFMPPKNALIHLVSAGDSHQGDWLTSYILMAGPLVYIVYDGYDKIYLQCSLLTEYYSEYYNSRVSYPISMRISTEKRLNPEKIQCFHKLAEQLRLFAIRAHFDTRLLGYKERRIFINEIIKQINEDNRTIDMTYWGWPTLEQIGIELNQSDVSHCISAMETLKDIYIPWSADFTRYYRKNNELDIDTLLHKQFI